MKEMLPDYEPKPNLPTGLYHGIEPWANKTVCDPSLVGNPIRLYNGNNLETEEDLGFSTPHRKGFGIKRYYNSRDTDIHALGHGWKHGLELLIRFSEEFDGATYLKIIDETGRAVYFEDTGNNLYVGAFQEPTTVAVEDENYVWYRLDGSRYAFNAQSELIWIEDEVGNRQSFTYANSYIETVTDEATGRSLTFHYNDDNRIDDISGPITEAVPDGIWVRYGYDADDNLESVTYADGSGYDYVYGDPNDPHHLTEKHDKGDHLLSSWAYDSQGRAFESVTRDGQDVTIDYVDENKVEVTDAYGITRTYHIWDVDGLNRVTDIDGPPECPGCGEELKRLEYDADLHIIEVEYANGRINQYNDFDRRGNARVVTLAVDTPDEKTITYAFHPDMDAKLSQTELSVLGPGNKVTIWDYDDDGNEIPNENPSRLVHRKIEQGFTENVDRQVIPYEYVTMYTYNDKGQVLSIDGPRSGNEDTTTFTYCARGDLLTVTKPLVGTTRFPEEDYDEAGQAGRVIDPNGNAFTYAYDGRGRILSVTNEADMGTTTYDYNNAGDLRKVTAANEVFHDFTYDVLYGRLTHIADPLGNYVYYDYDEQGNRTEQSFYYHPVEGPDEHLYSMQFDYHGQTHPGKLWKVMKPDSSTLEEYTYDAGGNIQTVTDAAERTTIYDHDVFNRLRAVTQPGDVVTGYAYDGHHSLAEVTDAEGNVTSYVYDDLGWLVSTTSPDTGTTSYTYDEAGNLVAKQDANGNTAEYTYDWLNRLTWCHFPDKSIYDISYTYDQGQNGKGRLTGMTDRSGMYTYAYNPLGNLKTATKTIQKVRYETRYNYDKAGILTGTTYPDGRVITYELDAVGRVAKVTTNENRMVAENIDYYPFGPVRSLTYGNGVRLTRGLDQLYWITSIAAGGALDLEYPDPDPVGNITTITDKREPDKSQSFVYDALYRLKRADGVYGTIAFPEYDKVGNRLKKTIGDETYNYAYSPGTNRLSAITGAEDVQFSYDDNGNTTRMGENRFRYDPNNRMTRALKQESWPWHSKVGTYTYNGHGQRMVKRTDTTTIYHWDLQGHLIAETQKGGDQHCDYLYLGDMLLATVQDGSELHFVHTDHLGSPLRLTDETGKIVWCADYTPFGTAIVDEDPDRDGKEVEMNLRFPGQYFDQETGLHYNWHRYYEPGTGRYLRADPLSLSELQVFRRSAVSSDLVSLITDSLYSNGLSSPQSLNLYNYGLNNPCNLIDPFGLTPLCEAGCVLEGSARIVFEVHFTTAANALVSWLGSKIPMTTGMNVSATAALIGIAGGRTFVGAERLARKLSDPITECIENCRLEDRKPCR